MEHTKQAMNSGPAQSRRIFVVSMAGLAVAAGGLTQSGSLLAQEMRNAAATAANAHRTALHQEIRIDATPERVYGILLDSKKFAAMTGLAATIDPAAGGSFSMFGGLIVGRNVELVPDKMIVQAWRPTHWAPGVYSMVKFELRPQGAGTLVVLDHTGFPEGDYDHLLSGWDAHYWEPMKNFVAQPGS
jgi:activator of HSP90 ATPase